LSRRRATPGQAVETAPAGSSAATGLKPGANDKLQKAEMRPTTLLSQ